MASYYKVKFKVGPGVPSGIIAVGEHKDKGIVEKFVVVEKVDGKDIRMLFVKFENVIPTDDKRFTKITAEEFNFNIPEKKAIKEKIKPIKPVIKEEVVPEPEVKKVEVIKPKPVKKVEVVKPKPVKAVKEKPTKKKK